jgi:hypothetical protein
MCPVLCCAVLCCAVLHRLWLLARMPVLEVACHRPSFSLYPCSHSATTRRRSVHVSAARGRERRGARRRTAFLLQPPLLLPVPLGRRAWLLRASVCLPQAPWILFLIDGAGAEADGAGAAQPAGRRCRHVPAATVRANQRGPRLDRVTNRAGSRGKDRRGGCMCAWFIDLNLKRILAIGVCLVFGEGRR